jgi:hypothetical protein
MANITKLDNGRLLSIMGSMGLDAAVKPSAGETGSPGSAIEWDLLGRTARVTCVLEERAVRFSVEDTEARVPLHAVNDWNSKATGSRALLNSTGAAVLESDLDLTGGVSVARVRDFLKKCSERTDLWLRGNSAFHGGGSPAERPETRSARIETDMNARKISRYLKSSGIEAEFMIDSDNEGQIIMCWRDDIITITIDPACAFMRCLLAIHVTGHTFSISAVNSWNRDRAMSCSYLSDEGAAVLESVQYLISGMTFKAVKDFVETFLWSVIMWKAKVLPVSLAECD